MQQNETAQLDGNDLRMIQLRFEGKTSAQIAAETGFEESSVRRLFMDGGRLQEHYTQYLRKQQNLMDENRLVLQKRIRNEQILAFERIVGLSTSAKADNVRLKANEAILNFLNIGHDDTLRTTLGRLSYAQAVKKVEILFFELFGRSFNNLNDNATIKTMLAALPEDLSNQVVDAFRRYLGLDENAYMNLEW